MAAELNTPEQKAIQTFIQLIGEENWKDVNDNVVGILTNTDVAMGNRTLEGMIVRSLQGKYYMSLEPLIEEYELNEKSYENGIALDEKTKQIKLIGGFMGACMSAFMDDTVNDGDLRLAVCMDNYILASAENNPQSLGENIAQTNEYLIGKYGQDAKQTKTFQGFVTMWDYYMKVLGQSKDFEKYRPETHKRWHEIAGSVIDTAIVGYAAGKRQIAGEDEPEMLQAINESKKRLGDLATDFSKFNLKAVVEYYPHKIQLVASNIVDLMFIADPNLREEEYQKIYNMSVKAEKVNRIGNCFWSGVQEILHGDLTNSFVALALELGVIDINDTDTLIRNADELRGELKTARDNLFNSDKERIFENLIAEAREVVIDKPGLREKLEESLAIVDRINTYEGNYVFNGKDYAGTIHNVLLDIANGMVAEAQEECKNLPYAQRFAKYMPVVFGQQVNSKEIK